MNKYDFVGPNSTNAKKVLRPPLNTAGPITPSVATALSENEMSIFDLYNKYAVIVSSFYVIPDLLQSSLSLSNHYRPKFDSTFFVFFSLVLLIKCLENVEKSHFHDITR